MRTIGKFLHDARVQKRYSKSKLEDATKIKSGFIEALENENWDRLPEYPVLQGFVGSISKSLDLDKKQAIALLRRDYPPKVLSINPKPDVSEKFVWSPKLTFLLGVFIISLMVLGYLLFQYISFITPPTLSIDSPSDGQIVRNVSLKVVGMVDKDATVLVNNQPALLDEQGSFSATIEIFDGTEEVIIKATSRSGKETVVRRKIDVQLGD